MFECTARSLRSIGLPLFVPANRPDRTAKAVAARPDAVILDLEDAIDPAERDAAREIVAGSDVELPVPTLLRINGVGTPWHEADLAAAANPAIFALVLPKAENADDVAGVAKRAGKPVIALIETAVGISRVNSIARASSRLAFGSIDFAMDMGIEHTPRALLLARSRIVEASRLADIPPPLDGVTLALDDVELLREDCRHAVELGFAGKLLIHPSQITPAREAMAPRPEEVRWAKKIIDAAARNPGVFRLEGQMVDAPVLRRARRIADEATKAGGPDAAP